MRICVLSTSFPRYPGDFAGIFVYDLINELAKQGVEIRVVAPLEGDSPHEQYLNKNLLVYRFSYALPRGWQRLAYGYGIPDNLLRNPLLFFLIPGFMIMFLKTAWRVCQNCDLIHVHWAPLAWIGLILKRRYRIPLVVSVHGTDVRALPSILIRPVLKKADAVVAAAKETELLLQKMGITRYHAIALPINEAKFKPTRNPGNLWDEIGIHPGSDVVTFVGRLIEFRDPSTLIRAVPSVLAQRPQTKFVIVGDGPLAPNLRSSIDDLGVGHAVHLVGARGDVERFLAISKLFVALSPVDNIWSMALTEAIHMRVPCILSLSGQTKNVFTHLKDSYLVEPRNEVQLANAIVYLLSREDILEQLKIGALRLLIEHGKDRDSIMQRVFDLYGSLSD
jgi:glycosyltransferase involved in cell wall biosynthesis